MSLARHLDEVFEISDVAAEVEDEGGTLDLLGHVVLRWDAIPCNIRENTETLDGGGRGGGRGRGSYSLSCMAVVVRQ